MASIQNIIGLNIRQLYNLLRALNGGTAGFNYAQYRKEELIAFVRDNYTDEQVNDALNAVISMPTRAALPTTPPPSPLPIAAAVERLVHLAPDVPARLAAAPAPAAAVERVHYDFKIERKPIKEVFGINIKGEVDCYNDAEAPEVDPHFDWTPLKDQLRIAILCLEAVHNSRIGTTLRAWLNGEKGTGKTEFARQLAARLGRAFYRCNFDRYTERTDFVGGMSLVAGSTQWMDGVVIRGMRHPGAIILLDEPSKAQPGNVSVLNAILELGGGYRINETGERVNLAKGAAFFAADNTNGLGDATGRYRGAETQDVALLDRFQYRPRFSHMTPAQERKIIISRSGVDEAAADDIVAMIGRCRQMVVAGELNDAPSLRGALAMAWALVGGVNMKDAWDYAIVAGVEQELQETVRQVFVAHTKTGGSGLQSTSEAEAA